MSDDTAIRTSFEVDSQSAIDVEEADWEFHSIMAQDIPIVGTDGLVLLVDHEIHKQIDRFGRMPWNHAE